MCSRNILIIFIEIAVLLQKLMRANFVATDNMLNQRLASLPWADKLPPAQDADQPDIPSRKQVTLWAQSAFMFICDLYNLTPETEKDKAALVDAAKYIDILINIVSTMPDFVPAKTDPLTEKSYESAVEKLESGNKYAIKNSLIICRNQIFQKDDSSVPQTKEIPTADLQPEQSPSPELSIQYNFAQTNMRGAKFDKGE